MYFFAVLLLPHGARLRLSLLRAPGAGPALPHRRTTNAHVRAVRQEAHLRIKGDWFVHRRGVRIGRGVRAIVNVIIYANFYMINWDCNKVYDYEYEMLYFGHFCL